MLAEEDRLISTAAIDGTNRLPHDSLFVAYVCAPTTFIDQPNLAEQSHVHRE